MKTMLELDATGAAKLREERNSAIARGITLSEFLRQRGKGETEAQYYGTLKKFNLNTGAITPGFRAGLKKTNGNGKHFVEFAPVDAEKIEVEFPSGLIVKMRLVDLQKLAR